MSGSDAGREAAAACVTGFLSDYFTPPDSWSTETAGTKTLAALNRWLYAQGQRAYESGQGMVTTLSVMVIKTYEMLTGKLPYDDRELTARRLRHARYTPAAGLNPDVPG
jgi:hypothetical protein